MNKWFKIVLLIILIFVPIIFFKALNNRAHDRRHPVPVVHDKPQIAIIFDDVGGSLKELQTLNSLDIPLTVAIIPGLTYSRQISGLAGRYGFSVFVHIPLEPKNAGRYTFPVAQRPISASMSDAQIKQLLNEYLDSLRNAIGVNNHMGSAATENKHVMEVVLGVISHRGLAYVDSRTSLVSVAYQTAQDMNMIAGNNEGFIDAVNDSAKIEAKIDFLVQKAQEKGKIIIIGHPRNRTIAALRKKLPAIKEKVTFITMRDYFELH